MHGFSPRNMKYMCRLAETVTRTFAPGATIPVGVSHNI